MPCAPATTIRTRRAARAVGAAMVLAALTVPVVPVEDGRTGGGAADFPRAAARMLAALEMQPQTAADTAPAGDFALAPASPFVASYGDAASALRAETCLTEAIYYEGALEPEAGQRAIAQVVLNRVRHPAYPDNVCGVVFQGQERATGCQFTFTCDGSRARPPVASLWARANRVAKAALGGAVAAEVGLSTHYHADYVAPYWSASLNPSGQIGRHVFYRWRGDNGEPGAFTTRYSGREPLIAAWTARPAAPDGALPGRGSDPVMRGLTTAAAATDGAPEAATPDAAGPAPAPTPFRARPLPMAGKLADAAQ